jgi:1,4-dihydroxy-2-naphthoate octaprenyltransferase
MRPRRLLRLFADISQAIGVLLTLSGVIAADPAFVWLGIACMVVGLAAGVAHRMRYP